MPKPNWDFIFQISIPGAVAIIVGVLVNLATDISTAWTIIGGALFYLVLIFVVRFSWNKLERVSENLRRWSATPKVKCWFELPSTNNLKLFLYNPKGAKDTYVECRYEDYKDIRGRRYSDENRNKLKLMENASGGNPPFFRNTLTSNDKREIPVGVSYRETIALFVGDAHVFGYVDGMFEYIISCNVNYIGKRRVVKKVSVWLTIKNGELIEIKETL